MKTTQVRHRRTTRAHELDLRTPAGKLLPF
jgi:hypothetical protein